MDILLDLTMIVSAALVLLYLKHNDISFKNDNPFRKPDFKLLDIIVILRICWSMFAQQFAFATLPDSPSEETTMDILSALSAIILSPITEEITFRYGIINIGKKYQKNALAIILSVVLFVIVHFPNLPTAVNMTGSAFLYAFMYYKTGNIIYSVTVHSANNFFSVLTYYIPQMEKMCYASKVDELLNPYFITSFLVFIPCLVFLFKYDFDNVDKMLE
ncbi:MAG: CPBP family intramembrane metalloprotease [Ruminococcus sp.]|uniref:CPBP family intramembrane glutamic endopeptidase n=1 Tax=Ruminococcus sp. TaxID=41978 RepID=UPI0025E47CCB|nr:CPBP family intramembrane glutamic endopeptidase [Ruminococcus sp.]MCR5541723.1 CPBP family intramembrane metalloprotease [Ruminococcus sp.]